VKSVSLGAQPDSGARTGSEDVLDPEDEALDVGELARAAETVLRLDAIVGLFRPLAEGIAMFAELDASTSASSDYAPQPFLALNRLWGGADWAADNEDLGTATGGILRILEQARVSDDGLRRRMNLLTQTFDPGAGGYLPGYLTVKQFWVNNFLQGGLEPADSGLCLGLVRSFFYDDYTLVAQLLQTRTWGVQSYEALRDHVAGRLRTLFKDLTVADLRAYERAALQNQFRWDENRDARLEYLHCDAGRYQEGVAALQREIALVARALEEDDADPAAMVAHGLLLGRRQVRVARAEAICHLGEGAGVGVVDPVTGEGWTTPAMPPPPGTGVAAGLVEVHYSTVDPRLEFEVVVSCGHWSGLLTDLAVLRVDDRALDVLPEGLRDRMVRVRSELSLVPYIAQCREIVRRGIPAARSLLSSYGFYSAEGDLDAVAFVDVRQLYWRYALTGADLAIDDDTRVTLDQRGLRAPVLGYDRNLLEALSWLGLQGASGHCLGRALDDLAGHGVDVPAFIAHVKQSQQSGLTFLGPAGEDGFLVCP
jgi:hypothetical protein